MPKPIKYAQDNIASTHLYDTSPGQSRNKLYGFFNARRDRTWTTQARDAEVHPVVEPLPLGHDARKAFILSRSYLPLKRDRKSRRIK